MSGGASSPVGTRDALISADENREMFDRVARRYDVVNRIISLGMDKRWRRRAIASLGIENGGRVLDVGAGTGDLLTGILARTEASQVVGIDPSEEMMRLGVRKASDAGHLDRAAFLAGDAVALPFADNAFDGVILGFCIRNVTDRKRALAELHRVLRPGGRLVILELTTPVNPVARALHGVFTATVIPSAAKLLSLGSAYAYLVRSVRAFPSSRAFEAAIADAGFVDTGREPLSLGAVTVFFGVKPT